MLEKQMMFKRKESSFRQTSLQHIYTVISMKVICSLPEVNQSQKLQCLNFLVLKIRYQSKTGSQAPQILFVTWEKFRDKCQRDKRPLKVKSIDNSSALKIDIRQPGKLFFPSKAGRNRKGARNWISKQPKEENIRRTYTTEFRITGGTEIQALGLPEIPLCPSK